MQRTDPVSDKAPLATRALVMIEAVRPWHFAKVARAHQPVVLNLARNSEIVHAENRLTLAHSAIESLVRWSRRNAR